jgi:hypothetical protein
VHHPVFLIISAKNRPPVAGVVGRGSGALRLWVVGLPDGSTLREVVRRMSWMVRVPTDEWAASDRIPEVGRKPATAYHALGEWARDDVGDGLRGMAAPQRGSGPG